MKQTEDGEMGGGREDPAAANVLRNVQAAAARLERSRRSYRAAIVAAVSLLEADGARDAYVQVGKAAGVSRQAVRQLFERYCDSVDD